MHYLKEGMEKLKSMKIPYSIGTFGQREDDCFVWLQQEFSDKLRMLGFRVGKGILEGEQVVYYKGRFFGLTTY